MSKNTNFTADKEITAEACAWVAQLESGNLTAADLSALREWMGRSPQHASEIKAIAALSGELSVLTELTENINEAIAADNALRRPAWKKLATSRGALVGAVACCFALVFGALIYANNFTAYEQPQIYATNIGEYNEFTLRDGSTVKLNTASQVEVAYTDDMRRIRLIEGEAFFDVAHNPDRPFVVYSGEMQAQAIGTSFVVRLRDMVTELSVVDGVVAFSKVALSDAGQNEGGLSDMSGSARKIGAAGRSGFDQVSEAGEGLRRVLVQAGQTLLSTNLDDAASAEVVSPIDVDARAIQRKLSWTEGLFDFSDTPLEEVVAEINRHNSVVVEIADPELKQLRFGGMFRTGDLDSLLDALTRLDVDVLRSQEAGNDETAIIILKKSDLALEQVEAAN